MANAYIGLDDYRGSLAARASGPGGMDANAQRALQIGVGNDGNFNPNQLNSFYDSPTGNRSAERDALVSWAKNDYNNWLAGRQQNNTGVLGAGTTRISGGSSTGGGADTGVDKAAIQRQIDQLNSMLGVYAHQKQSGLSDIDNKFNESDRRLGEQRASALTGYQDQETQALEGRTRGYEQVDNYANNSANSLNRIFQGANAGNSSVARLLAPQLVGKAADSRRLDVTTTANQNLSGIKKARDEATSEFDYAQQDLENNSGYEKDAFEKNLTQQELDQYNQKLALESEGGFNTAGTQNEINSRTARLSQLFGAGKFNPQYQARAVAPKAVQLNDYKVDPVQVQAGQTGQGESSYYNPLLRKKQELRVR